MSTSNSPTTDLCAVCDQPGRFKCSACKSLRVCSSTCSSLLWPTHKVLCGRDVDKFFMPPMSLEHLEQLEQIKDEWEGSSFLSAMNITWTDLSDILLSPAQADPVDEYLRLSALLSSYHRLYEAVRDGDSHVKVSPSPWIYFSKRGRACLAHYNTAAFGPSSASTWIRHREAIYAGRSPFTMINALLRQELVFATVDFQALRRPPLVDSGRIAGTMSIALRRAIDEVHRVPGLSDEQRARFEFAWGRTALAL